MKYASQLSTYNISKTDHLLINIVVNHQIKIPQDYFLKNKRKKFAF